MSLNKELKTAFERLRNEAASQHGAFGPSYKFFMSISEDCRLILDVLDKESDPQGVVDDLMTIRDDLERGKKYLNR